MAETTEQGKRKTVVGNVVSTKMQKTIVVEVERRKAHPLYRRVVRMTKKPAETRMGKGKGAPDHWVAVVRPGKILFEMEGVSHADAQQAMKLAAHKLPLRTEFVSREATV